MPSFRICSAARSSEIPWIFLQESAQERNLIGHRIGACDRGITEDFELPAIMRPKQREKIVPHDVVAEIGRDVSDPQPSFRIGLDRYLIARRLGRAAVAPVPFPALVKDRPGAAVRMKGHREDEIAVQIGRSRAQG